VKVRKLFRMPGRPQLVYVAVADDIERRITSGEFPPGGKLPSEHDLAAEYQVSYSPTIRHAMQLLRERELIITIWGRGTFVAGDGEDE
jgi:GntR family transcriptional regulator